MILTDVPSFLEGTALKANIADPLFTWLGYPQLNPKLPGSAWLAITQVVSAAWLLPLEKWGSPNLRANRYTSCNSFSLR